jgi:hypothetical protein
MCVFTESVFILNFPKKQNCLFRTASSIGVFFERLIVFFFLSFSPHRVKSLGRRRIHSRESSLYCECIDPFCIHSMSFMYFLADLDCQNIPN